MDIRKIALALPLVVGVACQTSRGSSDRTASAQEPSTTSSTARAGASGQTGDITTGAGASAQGSVDPYDTDASATARAGDTTVSGAADADTGATPGISGSADVDSGTGSMSGSGSMTGMAGSDVKEHASDQVVMGKVKKISQREIDIEAIGGEKTTLRIVPETLVTVDGRDAKPTQLREGQEVRASYNEVEGKETAVRIEAGMGTGSSGSMHPGTSGSGSMSPGGGTGTMDPGTSGTGTMEPGTGTGDTTGTGSTGTGDTTGTGSSSGSMSPGGGTGGTTTR